MPAAVNPYVVTIVASVSEEVPQRGVSTTPADLVSGIDDALRRCFHGIDLGAEAGRLGLPMEAMIELQDALMALRDIASRADAGTNGRSS